MNCADPTEHRAHGQCDGNVGLTVQRLRQEICDLIRDAAEDNAAIASLNRTVDTYDTVVERQNTTIERLRTQVDQHAHMLRTQAVEKETVTNELVDANQRTAELEAEVYALRERTAPEMQKIRTSLRRMAEVATMPNDERSIGPETYLRRSGLPAHIVAWVLS